MQVLSTNLVTVSFLDIQVLILVALFRLFLFTCILRSNSRTKGKTQISSITKIRYFPVSCYFKRYISHENPKLLVGLLKLHEMYKIVVVNIGHTLK